MAPVPWDTVPMPASETLTGQGILGKVHSAKQRHARSKVSRNASLQLIIVQVQITQHASTAECFWKGPSQAVGS